VGYPDAARVLVSVTEACVTVLSRRHDRFRILYVAKIDSKGQDLTLPPTATLVRAFVRRYADPATRPITWGSARWAMPTMRVVETRSGMRIG